MRKEWRRDGDFSLTDEDAFAERLTRENYDVVVADVRLKRAAVGFRGEFWDFPHFAVSGRLFE